jgi:hypothetical protein
MTDHKTNIEKGEKAFAELLELSKTNDGWSHNADKDGVQIYKREVEGSSITMMKGIAKIKASAADILALTNNLEGRTKWDELLIEASVIETIDEHHRVCHLKFKSPSFAVSNRDFILAYADRKNEDGTYQVSAVSTTHDKGDECKGFVRGEIFSSGYYIKPIGDKECECIYIVQLDPKGWVPTMVVNLVATKQPLVLAKMREALEK